MNSDPAKDDSMQAQLQNTEPLNKTQADRRRTVQSPNEGRKLVKIEGADTADAKQ